MEGNSHPSPRNPDSPKQDKSKAKHPRYMLIKLTKIKHQNKILKHQNKILKAPRLKQQITHKRIPIRITTDLSQKLSRPEGMAGYT